MNAFCKITSSLLDEIHSDLERPHPFAYERIGFFSAGLSHVGNDLLILAREYRPIADDDYLEDYTVGAKIGPNAIRSAMQWAMDTGAAIFHVHRHGRLGVPSFSRVDLQDNVRLIPDFFKVAPQCAHGSIVLSNDAACGMVWINAKQPPIPIQAFSVVGAPVKKWRAA